MAVQKLVDRRIDQVKIGDYVELPDSRFNLRGDSRDEAPDRSHLRGRVWKVAKLPETHSDWWCVSYLKCTAAEAVKIHIERAAPDTKSGKRHYTEVFNPQATVKVRVWRLCRKPCCSRCRMAPGPEKFICADHWPGRA